MIILHFDLQPQFTYELSMSYKYLSLLSDKKSMKVEQEEGEKENKGNKKEEHRKT